jgi:hypothetical protein
MFKILPFHGKVAGFTPNNRVLTLSSRCTLHTLRRDRGYCNRKWESMFWVILAKRLAEAIVNAMRHTLCAG